MILAQPKQKGWLLTAALLFACTQSAIALPIVTDVYTSDSNIITSFLADTGGAVPILTINEQYGESVRNPYPIDGYDALTGGTSGNPVYFDKVVDQDGEDIPWQINMNIINNTGLELAAYTIEFWDDTFANPLDNDSGLVSELLLAAPPGTTLLSSTPASATFVFNDPLSSSSSMVGSFKVDFDQTGGSFGMRQVALVSSELPAPASLLLVSAGLGIFRLMRRNS